jgi:SAM-dependent methyltransferase
MSELRAWPGGERRKPRRSSSLYAIRGPIARWLREEARTASERFGRPYRVLDVGCGTKPYYPFFEPFVGEYVGIDAVENELADLKGRAEALPVADASFDLVLCLQMLEHADDPGRVVRELRRVSAPGGLVLASTHGVQVYHPCPHDLWRWTHTGLERLFSENGDWASFEVRPGAGTTATLAMLEGTYVDLVFQRLRVRALGRPLVWSLNVLAAGIDRCARSLREPIPGSLIANYHITAEVGE